MQNASIESFNGRFREECLDQSWFTSLAEARRVIEAWRARLQRAAAAHEPAAADTGCICCRSTVYQAAAVSACTKRRLTRCCCRPHRAGVTGRLRILLTPGPTKGAGSLVFGIFA